MTADTSLCRAEDEVRQWASQLDVARRRRDTCIREMACQGASLRRIAAAAGLCHQAVAKIVARSE